jgi:8-oxo-dGTP diphosphatase
VTGAPPVPYTPILATLGYVMSPDAGKVLLIHRNARPDDQHLGKYNGLGGKLEPLEDVVAGMRRELREEAGIEAADLRLRGTVSWPGFGKGGEDWFGFVFRIDSFTGEPHSSNPEGTLEWVPAGGILDLPLWEGDRYFLPLVFDPLVRQFHGVMPYRDGRPVSWTASVEQGDTARWKCGAAAPWPGGGQQPSD